MQRLTGVPWLGPDTPTPSLPLVSRCAAIREERAERPAERRDDRAVGQPRAAGGQDPSGTATPHPGPHRDVPPHPAPRSAHPQAPAPRLKPGRPVGHAQQAFHLNRSGQPPQQPAELGAAPLAGSPAQPNRAVRCLVPRQPVGVASRLRFWHPFCDRNMPRRGSRWCVLAPLQPRAQSARAHEGTLPDQPSPSSATSSCPVLCRARCAHAQSRSFAAELRALEMQAAGKPCIDAQAAQRHSGAAGSCCMCGMSANSRPRWLNAAKSVRCGRITTVLRLGWTGARSVQGSIRKSGGERHACGP